MNDYANVAVEICNRHADRVTRVALLEEKALGTNCYTFGGLDYLSDKFAVVLRDCGVTRSDSVVVALGQSAALLVAQLGAIKLGASACVVPPGTETGLLEFAILENGAKTLIAGSDAVDTSAGGATLGGIDNFFRAGGAPAASPAIQSTRDFWKEISLASSDFTLDERGEESAGFVFFRPGSRGGHKAVAIPSDALRWRIETAASGWLSVRGEGELLWCGADWTMPEVLLDVIYPALWRGASVMTKEAYDASSESLLRAFLEHEISVAFLSVSQLEALLGWLDSEPGAGRVDLPLILIRDSSIDPQFEQRVKERLGGGFLNLAERP